MTINDSTFGNRKLLLGQNSGFEMQSQSVNQKEHGRWIDRTANIGTELRSLNTKKLEKINQNLKDIEVYQNSKGFEDPFVLKKVLRKNLWKYKPEHYFDKKEHDKKS